MRERFTARWFIIKLAGILFAVYSAYNVYLIVKDGSTMPEYGIFLTAIVATVFAVFTVFAWTSEARDIRFLQVRKVAFIIALIIAFVLKLRMVVQIVAYIDFSKVHTVLYGGAYFMTLAGLLVLFFYYVIVVKNLPFYPRASVILPLIALLMFLGSLALEIVFFFVYGINLEANPIRTMVIRPVFYLSFSLLSVYFLLPPKYSIPEFPI